MVGIGVIGYGYWGPNLVRNFSEAPGSKVVAVSDLRAERLGQMQMRYPGVKVSGDHHDVLDDPAVDAVAIATPVATHFDLAMEALHAGKHVFVEKPLAASAEQGERILEEAARCRCVLMVDHTFVYTGAVRKIKELVRSGRLGQLYYYDSVRVNLGLFQHDVNVLWDLAVHDLAIMDYVLDVRPCGVGATGIAHVPGKPKDVAYLTCFFEDNLIAHFHVNWLSPVKVRKTLIGGAQQMIVYDDLEPSEKIKVYDKGITLNNGADGKYDLLVGYRAGDMWAPQLDSTEALRIEAMHFVDCVENGRTPITSGEVGLRVVRILEAATQSMSQRGRPVELHWERDRN
ncbi:MAG TPA: Gfo/Idh/MocA family oxidoreductase [Candidatus Binatia bacterium]|jgi:predicted dehydrogenase